MYLCSGRAVSTFGFFYVQRVFKLFTVRACRFGLYDAGKPQNMLADIVAWANNHGQEPKGSVSLDFRNQIEQKLKIFLLGFEL